LEGIQKRGVHTCLFENNADAIIHSRKIGLITDEAFANYIGRSKKTGG